MMLSTGKRAVVTAIAGVVIAPLVSQAASAGASPTGPNLRWQRTLSKSLVGPLQLAVHGRNVYVADAFQSILRRVGGPTLVHGPSPRRGGDIAGVAVNTGNGDIAYTSTYSNSHTYTAMTVLRHGKKYKVTNLARYERLANPDGNRVYGLPDPAAHKCAANALAKHHIPVHYTGTVDSHPYAIAYLRFGAYAVADAGGNDIVRVGPKGVATRIAVLPRQAFVVTQAFATANKFPACVVGLTYYTEAVPTDVERGPDGNLYVSTLPGGPEGPNVGPRGSVYRINRTTHKVTRIATGFAGATNLAVTRHGQIYVAELSANRISTIQGGAPKPVFRAAGLVAVETANLRVYAATAPALVNVNKGGRIWVLRAVG